ncbi:TadE/TadG family type IV pilus assembly protein [Mesorhizobium sp.]|uniref:TadE/TadG family type IV pilus assembly protein n=1 Tax=Mesorhizobium sp. TaxID=1871066 RepID=UPI000FE8E4CE|nr:TadE/TadG family type IV pilus assembly protein [Mesorhizobium sp.]RWI11400.1 MAG: pilus assembly protein [Mesorhizobium sp.]RWM85103.1 MAG: pilus assembly protein [Mesorhizobium sp.]
MCSFIARCVDSVKRLARQFRREERGAILVELTLITPLMIALTAGVFEFGTIIHRKLLIEAGLRDAARFMARCTEDFVNPDPGTDYCVSTAQNIAKYGTPAAGTLRVADWDIDEPVVISTYPTANTVDPGTGLQDYRGTGATVSTIRVTTTYNYGAGSLLFYIGVGQITIAASHEERFVGY